MSKNLKKTKEKASKAKISGEFYTPVLLANFVASQIVEHVDSNLDIKVLDPAVGDGELLLAIAKKLEEKKQKNVSLIGYDINNEAVNAARQKLFNFKDYQTSLSECDFIDSLNPPNLFTLNEAKSLEKFDVVISNPPYVRTQIMGNTRAKELSESFNLSGRIDLYHVFIEGISRILKPGGLAGIIVSNRFMTTKTGSVIRKRILEEFEILHIWDFGDTHLFKAAVLPAVLLLKKKKLANSKNIAIPFTSVYSTKDHGAKAQIENIFENIANEGAWSIGKNTYIFKHGILSDKSEDGVWCLETEDSEKWLDTVNKNTWQTFEDVGKIRVGIKTTADKVFIRSDWHQISKKKPELLKPIVNHDVARRFRALSNKGLEILYPYRSYEGKRELLDIEKYPITKKYLFENQEVLKGRKYIAESKRKWYEIWVPHNPELWKYPKVIFRDIAEKPTFWIDFDQSIVNGDCYWLVSEKEGNEDLLWLVTAVANSSFIEKFYDLKFHNKLYSGRRRFMTQYVRQFPLPDPENPLSKKIVNLTKEIYKKISSKDSSLLEDKLDNLIWEVFGLGKEILR